MKFIIDSVRVIRGLNVYTKIFFFAAIIGTIAIESNSEYFMNPDSTGYHNLAMDIIENGELNKFFREPGYPYFLAGCYKVYAIFGSKPEHLLPENYNVDERMINVYKPEMQFVKYMQLLILILSIMFFYATIKNHFSESLSRATAYACSLFYPLSVSSTYLLREPLLVLVTSLISYLISQYLIRKKTLFLFTAAFLTGIGALIFQVYLVFFVIIILAAVINNKSFKAVITAVLFSAIIFAVTIFPWCYKAYRCYPDLKVIRTAGSSLTYESVLYITSLRSANENGILSDKELDDLQQRNWYKLSDRELFERSFDGWYVSQADSLKNLANISLTSSLTAKAKSMTRYAMNVFLHKDFSPLSSNYQLNAAEKKVKSTLQGFSVIIAIFSFLGLVFIPKKKLINLMPQSMFILLFFVLGSENRRFLPSLPLVLLLFCYFVIEYLIPVKNRYTNKNKKY